MAIPEHAGPKPVMRAWYCHHFVLPLPDGHRFPMAKYRALYERVAANAAQLGVELVEPAPAGDSDLLRVHTSDYLYRVCAGALTPAEMRRIGFPWSPAAVERSRRSSGATIAALCAATAGDRVALNLAGGTHHAFADHGGGYCIFNDSVVAARHAQAHGLARRVLIVDLDVHQGDGTASLCADDPSIFTFSMHAANNYPSRKERSDLDVELPDGCDDATYLDRLASHLPRAMGEARADAAIFLAGADPFVGDRLGRLALTKAGLRERDRMVFAACGRHDLPVAASMAGGYADDVADIVDIHFATVCEAAAYARRTRG
jgi:acetoin utilization deacetylase AcuC-like enzyme